MRQWDYPARERGSSDHDQPYRFGHLPRTDWPYPFTMKQFVKLFLLRTRVRSSAIEGPTNVPIAEIPLD